MIEYQISRLDEINQYLEQGKDISRFLIEHSGAHWLTPRVQGKNGIGITFAFLNEADLIHFKLRFGL